MMQKDLGISALVIAILAVFILLLGTWLTVLVALLATFAYGSRLGFPIRRRYLTHYAVERCCAASRKLAVGDQTAVVF